MTRTAILDCYPEGDAWGEQRNRSLAKILDPGVRVKPQQRPDLEGYSHLVITGSPRNITSQAEDAELITRAAPWIAQARKEGIPTLGICYGHQLIAHLLGAKVKPGVKERGICRLQLQRSLPFLPQGPFLVQQHHDYSVAAGTLEEGTDCLDQNGTVQAFRLRSEPVFGVQFHPETETDWEHSPDERERTAYQTGQEILRRFLQQ